VPGSLPTLTRKPCKSKCNYDNYDWEKIPGPALVPTNVDQEVVIAFPVKDDFGLNLPVGIPDLCVVSQNLLDYLSIMV
jgi:hypothetical protein